MMYKIVHDGCTILETTTMQLVFECRNNSEAKSLTRSLNLGSGFDGKTPAFFCESLNHVN